MSYELKKLLVISALFILNLFFIPIIGEKFNDFVGTAILIEIFVLFPLLILSIKDALKASKQPKYQVDPNIVSNPLYKKFKNSLLQIPNTLPSASLLEVMFAYEINHIFIFFPSHVSSFEYKFNHLLLF